MKPSLTTSGIGSGAALALLLNLSAALLPSTQAWAQMGGGHGGGGGGHFGGAGGHAMAAGAMSRGFAGHGGFAPGTGYWAGGRPWNGGGWGHDGWGGGWGWDNWGWGLGMGLGLGYGAWALSQPYYYAPGWGYGMATPVYPSTVVVNNPSTLVTPPGTTYLGPPASAAPVQNWFYCDSAHGYYPYVPQCPEPWRAVPAIPPGSIAQ